MEAMLEFDEIWKDIKKLMDGMMVMVKDLARSKGLNLDELLEVNKSINSEEIKGDECEIGQQSPLKPENSGAASNLFDKMPSLPSKKQNEGNDNTKDDVLPAVCFSQVMGSEVGIKEDEPTNISLKTKLEEVFDIELTQDLSPKLNHLGADEESLATVKNGDQHFGSAADFTTNMEIFYQIILENDTFQLFDEMPISAMYKNMPHLAFTQTAELIKCKCKNRAPLTDNDVAFYFDPGGCTLSEMNFESSEFYGDQGGLCLAFGLAPNVTDALVNAISHGSWIREAYGYRDVIDYSGTMKEFMGEEGPARNALTAWSPIDRDCEGRKIDHVILRDVLDSFVVIPHKNLYVCVVDWCARVTCGLALQFIFDMLLVFSPFQLPMSSANYQLTNSAIDHKLRKLVLQGPGHCIFLEHVKRIHRALESDDVALVWMMLCNGSRVEETKGLFCDTMIMDGKYDANQEPHGSEYLIYNFSLTESICYLFDPGGSYFSFIIWNREILPFLHGSGNATTVWILMCSKTKFNIKNQPSSEKRMTATSLFMGSVIDAFKGKQMFINPYSPCFSEVMVILWIPNVYTSILDILLETFGIYLVGNEMLNIWGMKRSPFSLRIAYNFVKDIESDFEEETRCDGSSSAELHATFWDKILKMRSEKRSNDINEETSAICLYIDLGDNHESLFTRSIWVDSQDGVTCDAVEMLENLAVVIMILIIGNLKRFVWDPGRDLYGNCMRCKTEAVVVIGPNRELVDNRTGSGYVVRNDRGGSYGFAEVVLGVDEAFAYVRKEKFWVSGNVTHLVGLISFGHDIQMQCCCIIERLIIIACKDFSWKHREGYASVMSNTARTAVFRTV